LLKKLFDDLSELGFDGRGVHRVQLGDARFVVRVGVLELVIQLLADEGDELDVVQLFFVETHLVNADVAHQFARFLVVAHDLLASIFGHLAADRNSRLQGILGIKLRLSLARGAHSVLTGCLGLCLRLLLLHLRLVLLMQGLQILLLNPISKWVIAFLAFGRNIAQVAEWRVLITLVGEFVELLRKLLALKFLLLQLLH
jgi:hypothetical protein